MDVTGSVMVDDEDQGGLRNSAPDARTTPGAQTQGPDAAPGLWHPTGVAADGSTVPRHAPKTPVRRETAMWLVCVGVVAVVAVALAFGAREGALALSALLLTGAVARAVIPGPGPIGITVRSRGVDVAMFASLGLMIAALAQTAPNI